MCHLSHEIGRGVRDRVRCTRQGEVYGESKKKRRGKKKRDTQRWRWRGRERGMEGLMTHCANYTYKFPEPNTRPRTRSTNTCTTSTSQRPRYTLSRGDSPMPCHSTSGTTSAHRPQLRSAALTTHSISLTAILPV